MAGHWLLSGLITVLGALLLRAGAQQQEVKLVGSDVTLVPTYTGNPSEINWKINGNKLVDMTLDPYDEQFYRLQDRASIDRTNGALTIKNLTIGDSGDYLAEPVVNGHFQYKEFTLIVRACPAEPTISDDSTEETIELRCESSTPDVSYEWFNKTVSIGKNPSYTEPRPKHNVNLTCVVDNGVCKKTAFKIISYTPEPSGGSGGIIAAILITVLVLALILIPIIIALCYQFRDKECIGRVYSAITNKKESRVNVFRNVHSRFFCFKGNNRVNNPLSCEFEELETTPPPESVSGYYPVNNPPSCESEEVETASPPESGYYPVNNPPSCESEEVETASPPESERPESQLTFQPKNLPSEAPITWKDDQPVNIVHGGGRIKSDPNGDLTINNVTSEGKGKFTICSEDQ